ncbi:MAG: OmpH family outer membrane protein [Acidobacteria bacterium]|nr:OmpH family outer membrane protein [Acidobacteriota bacterium]
MRVFIGAAVLSVMLAAAPTYAQAPQGQAPAPPAPAPVVQQAPAPKPFPEGTKYAVVNIQRIANESSEGKTATARVQALNQQKVNELNVLNKELQALQQKLEAGANVLSVAAAADLQKGIERKQVDIQRFTEDAQEEIAALQQQLQAEFEQKLSPIINAVAVEKGLHMIFSAADAGLVWGDPSLDITPEIIARFNTAGPAAAAPAAGAPAPAPDPAPPAPAPTQPAAPTTPAPPANPNQN